MPDLNELKNSVHYCLQYQGKHETCITCPLHAKKLCTPMIDVLERANTHMVKKYHWLLGFDDRKDILNDLFKMVLSRLGSLRSPRSFSAWAWCQFSAAKNDFLKTKGRISNSRPYVIPEPPDNIEELCAQSDGYFQWSSENNILHLKRFPLPLSLAGTMKSAAAFSINPDSDRQDARRSWDKEIDKIYRFSYQPQLQELEENQKNQQPDVPEEDNLATDSMLAVFSRSKSTRMKNCAQLFQALLDNNGDRARLARSRNKSQDAITKNISRCYKVYRQQVLTILRRMRTETANACYDILHALFAIQDAGARKGMQQAVKKLAKERGMTVGSLQRRIYTCRVMLLRELESDNV